LLPKSAQARKATGDNKMKVNFRYGIGFWLGADIYSLINIILNLKHSIKHDVLTYNYLITGVAVLGLMLNIILMKKAKQ
jgi:hypothetical protein